MTEGKMTPPLPNHLRTNNYRRRGGVSRVAKGADCKSAGLRLRRFESYLPHHRWNVHHKVRQAPFAELVRLSKSSVAEEYYAERSGNRWVNE